MKKAKKLLKLTLNDGTDTPRTVCSGIAKWYAPEDLKGRSVILVANLKPAVLCGVESQGMILAADDGEDVKVLFVDGVARAVRYDKRKGRPAGPPFIMEDRIWKEFRFPRPL